MERRLGTEEKALTSRSPAHLWDQGQLAPRQTWRKKAKPLPRGGPPLLASLPIGCKGSNGQPRAKGELHLLVVGALVYLAHRHHLRSTTGGGGQSPRAGAPVMGVLISTTWNLQLGIFKKFLL